MTNEDKIILERAKRIIERQRYGASKTNAKLTTEQRKKMGKKSARTRKKNKKLKALYAMSSN